VTYCGIIGGSDGSGLIGATGNFDIQYNLMRDFPQHAVELSDNVSLDMRYNVIENQWNGFRIISITYALRPPGSFLVSVEQDPALGQHRFPRWAVAGGGPNNRRNLAS